VAAALAAVVAAGGLTAAAYTGVLPASVQSFAHRAVGAPAPHLDTPAGQPVTPSGPAPAPPGVYGLCHAYEHAKANSSGREKAAAFRKLAAAAGGAARVKAYCAAATHPGRRRPAIRPATTGATRPPRPRTPPPGMAPASRPVTLPTRSAIPVIRAASRTATAVTGRAAIRRVSAEGRARDRQPGGNVRAIMSAPGLVLAGRYRLESRIAAGAVGEVWRAEDLVLGRPVAVKLLQEGYAGHPRTLARFRAEARMPGR